MFMSTIAARAAAASAVAGAALFGSAAIAAADPPPNCTAADLAGTASGVSASMSVYLFTHPDVNDFFTSLKGQPRDQVQDDVQDYLDANPQVRTDIQGMRQPLADLRERCG